MNLRVLSCPNARDVAAMGRKASAAFLVCCALAACGTVPPEAGEPSMQPGPTAPSKEKSLPEIAPDPVPMASPAVPAGGQEADRPDVKTPSTEAVDEARSVFFPRRLAGMADDQKEKLRDCAEKLKQDSKKRVVLIGYSDDLGSRSYNIAITEQRIAAVATALRSLGVDRSQIRRNRSNSVKLASHACRTEACRQQMRRVEFLCGA